MLKGNLHTCALRFLAPQLLLSPPIPREPEFHCFDLQWHPAVAAPYGVSLPRELQEQALFSLVPLLWALMQLLDAFMCHIHSLHRRVGKICHSDTVLVLSVGLLCSARAAVHQAAKLAIRLFS